MDEGGHTTMPRLTMEAAHALQSSFAGRITSSHEAHVEHPDRPTVLIPVSTADVERALRLAQAANRRVFIRSGGNISTIDLGKSAGGVSEPGPAIVSMEEFGGVDVVAQRITVGAAATTADLAETLVESGLFLPLDDNPSQSIVSCVLSADASPFLRSGTGLGSLRNAVVEAEVVPIEGVGAGHAETVRNQALRDILTGDRRAVLTRLVFDAAPAATEESERWTRAWTTTYQPRSFARLCDALFGADGDVTPRHIDLSVRVTAAAYSMNLVIIRTTGHGDEAGEAAEAILLAALERAGLPVLDSRKVDGPGSSVAAWVTTGPGAAAQGEVLRRFGSNNEPRPFARFRDRLVDAVDFAIGATRTGRERAAGVRAWAELQLTPGGDVVARAQISDAEADPRVARAARQRMDAAILADTDSPSAATARPALVRRAPARAALRGVAVLPGLEPAPDFDLVSTNRAGSDKIPGFKGEVFEQSDGRDYLKQIKQYASTSYSAQVVAARMTPQLVAVPVDATDVALAVTYAAKEGLKVVARSGGHQYCGLSSGGSDTLLISMHQFDKVVFSPSMGTPSQATVGPGGTLKSVSTELRNHGVVIPHGECPLVNLGGHVQTGGVGHQLRSLGVMLDWVRSFKMVTRDPHSPVDDEYVEREFTLPQTGRGTGAPTDGDVFSAMLGGGPSSWGVLTEITFGLTPDGRYPASQGYTYAYPYALADHGFSVAMNQLAEWAKRQATGELPPGIDLFLSVISGDFPRPAVLLLETMCRDQAGVDEITTVVDAVAGAVSDLARLFARDTSSLQGPAKLSVIADDGVRKIGVTGLPKSGREFDLPYKKSLHITKEQFSTGFCEGFVKLVDDAYECAGLKVVFQGVVGGGDFSANGTKKTTRMQRRDALVQLVFDVFYEPGYEGAAEGLQERMKDLLRSFSGGEDVRMLWGTFEDADTGGRQLRMSRPEVQELYYDSLSEYQHLQQIKEYTDPADIFHTTFTVQPPG